MVYTVNSVWPKCIAKYFSTASKRIHKENRRFPRCVYGKSHFNFVYLRRTISFYSLHVRFLRNVFILWNFILRSSDIWLWFKQNWYYSTEVQVCTKHVHWLMPCVRSCMQLYKMYVWAPIRSLSEWLYLSGPGTIYDSSTFLLFLTVSRQQAACFIFVLI